VFSFCVMHVYVRCTCFHFVPRMYVDAGVYLSIYIELNLQSNSDYDDVR